MNSIWEYHHYFLKGQEKGSPSFTTQPRVLMVKLLPAVLCTLIRPQSVLRCAALPPHAEWPSLAFEITAL